MARKRKSLIDVISLRVVRRREARRSRRAGGPYDGLPLAERVGYLVGLFDSQLARNGVCAWVYNGYSASETPAIIRAVTFVPSAHTGEVVRLLVDIAEIGVGIEVMEKEPETGESSRRISGQVRRLLRRGGRYWKVRDAFIQDVERFLKGEIRAGRRVR